MGNKVLLLSIQCLLCPSSRRLMEMISGSGSLSFKSSALQMYVPKSPFWGVIDKIVFLVFRTVPFGSFQVTSGGGNPRTGQNIVVGTSLVARWFVEWQEIDSVRASCCK